MNRQHNNLTIEIYSSGTTRLADPRDELRWAEGIQFGKGYPAGLYLAGSFFIPRQVINSMLVRGAQRVIIRNGLTTVYEGYIDQLDSQIDAASQGVLVPLTGPWDTIAQKRLWDKPWSDNRVTQDIWKMDNTIDLEDWSVDRTNRIHISPNPGAFTNADYFPLTYTAPVGETVKRITCHEDFSEKAGQDWKMSIWRSTDGSSYTEMTNASGETYADGTTTVLSATGNDDIDVTLATPSRYIRLRMTSNGNNTVANRDHNHAQWTNLVLYTETGAIDIKEVATDIVGKFTTINSDVTHIASLTQDLTPFISDDQYVADILAQAAEAGDGSGGKIGYGFLPSEDATSRDGKPVLFVEAYPALTDYDYAIRLDDENVVPAVSIVQDFSQIWNDISVSYQDENGYTIKIVSATEASLTDATSVAAYGTRQYSLALGYSTAAVALENGQRFLAAKKDPQYVVTSPITVVGYIRSKQGEFIPSSEIEPGKRLKIENYNPELILLITGTDYDDASEQTSLSFGYQREPWLVLLTAPARMGTEPGDDADAAGAGSNTESLNWKRKWAKEFEQLGINPWTDKRSKKELIELAKKRRKQRG